MSVTSPFPLDLAVLAAALVIIFSLALRRNSLASLPLPPGPTPLPILGNVFDFPTINPQLKYREWREKYGDIIHLSAAGKHIIVLNSARVTFDLLEKRGRIYSDRPASVMAQMVGLDKTWLMHSYGDTLRQFRKLGRRIMGTKAIKKYERIQEEEARIFTSAVLQSPDNLVEHVSRATGSIMLRLLYGYSPSDDLDDLNAASQKLATDSSKLLEASSRLLDLFPILKYVPSWLPFLTFRRKAQDLGEVFHHVFHTPFDMVMRSLDSIEEIHSPSASLCATLLNEGIHGQGPTSDGQSLIRMFLGSTYPPGQETTASTLVTFFMLMATHPQIQSQAKAEIASVVGDHRLPALSDRQSLVYLSAVLKEVLRWHSVVPLGPAHRLVEEDEYNGLKIPEDSIVFPNIWEMMHDPEVYPEPFSFKPERFLDGRSKTESGHSYDPFDYVFGFGRRSCPGVHLAEASLLVFMATILATCDIEPCRNPDGSEISIKAEFTPTLVSHLIPFKCVVKSHSPNAASLLQHALDGTRSL